LGIALLAPVPARFLKSALVVCADQGRVAFGTAAWELFSKVDDEYGAGIPVLIYPTHPDHDPDHLCTPSFVGFRAAYSHMQKSKVGKHPIPALRPIGTVDGDEPDTGWALFWEVTELARLPKESRIAITSLTGEGQNKPLSAGFVPHGPMLVKATFL
jgi:hypothetical protein